MTTTATLLSLQGSILHTHAVAQASAQSLQTSQPTQCTLLQTIMNAMPPRPSLPLNPTHTAAFSDLMRSQPRKSPNYQMDIPTAPMIAKYNPLSTVHPPMDHLHRQTHQLPSILRVVQSSVPHGGMGAKFSKSLSKNTPLGIYAGAICRQQRGDHCMLLRDDPLHPDGPLYVDGTPPVHNSTAHTLSMINEYLWVEDDFASLPPHPGTMYQCPEAPII